MTSVEEAVHRRLSKVADPEHARNLLRFFKTGPGDYGEGDQFLGLRLPDLRKAVREFRGAGLEEIEAVLHSPWHEERGLALMVLVHQYARGDKGHRERIYRLYLRNTRFVNNWDLVDGSAPQIVGTHLLDKSSAPLETLARSKSLWERRIAMLATAAFIRENRFEETLRIAEILLDDEHDLMHKATGWMLREVGKRDREAEEVFLRRFASRMPRTMLRYAIERFPEPVRRRYLSVRRSTR